jgi:hypothetical protein
MNSLIEQSQAYWNLGMTDEARALAGEALALERAASGGESIGPAAEWWVDLAYRCGDLASAAARGLREPRFPNPSGAVEAVALSLHHLGRHDEAVNILSPRVREFSRPHDCFQMACFLCQAGRVDESVEYLFRSLAHFRHERRETWFDGDLKRLWAVLAGGGFSLATAHRLVESEFEILREWQPGRAEAWLLDPLHFKDLPPELRPLFEPFPRWAVHPMIPTEAMAAPALVERFERWARDEVAANQRAFDAGRAIALRRVLDAQPHYAQAAWSRGDLCALRYHVQWAVLNDPGRLHDFAHITGIEPLLDEVRRMLASDREFFAKLDRAARLPARDVDTAIEIIKSLPSEWSSHPLVLLNQACALTLGGRHGEALTLLLPVCDLWPDDASPFVNAARSAIQAGRDDLVAEIRARTPRVAHVYRSWTGVEGWLNCNRDLCRMGDFEAKNRPFRGQPDLGGHIQRDMMLPPEEVPA